MSQIKTIVFDIGKVLFDYDPEQLIDIMLPGTPHKKLYLEELFLAELWQDLDRGDHTPDSGLELFRVLYPNLEEQAYKNFSVLIFNFAKHLPLIEGSKRIFEHLSKEYKLYLLTNFQDKPFDLLTETHPFLKQAKGQIVSAKVNCMKPEAEIYAKLLSTYPINPAETLFIDDKTENLGAAVKFGIKTIHFTTPDQLKKDLQSHQIFIN